MYSSIPSKDTCHRRIKRVTKQTVYNCINDFLAWGYVRKRGRNEMRNHRQGHLPVIHWPKLKSIVLEDPSLFIDEMRDKLNEQCNTKYHYSVIAKALVKHNLIWKKITRMARQQDHVLRREYQDTICRYKADQIYCFDESHFDQITGQRKRGRTRRGRPCVMRSQFQGTRTRATLMDLFCLLN